MMIYGLHDEHPKGLMKEGWVLLTKEVGHDPNNHDGEDFSEWRKAGIEPIVRLSNGYGSAGTIPLLQYYGDFAVRCANYVQASQGCDRYIIGNEPNHSQERPGGVPITAQNYVNCFRVTRDRIKQVSPQAQVMTAPVAVWNVETGDWLEYFDVLMQEAEDGIALHTYTHGSDPSLITSEAKMDYPYHHRRYNFRAYRDFLDRVPENKRHLPVYITETDQDVPWLNENNGWIRWAYKEINHWNQYPDNQKIHCLCLYRWPRYDKWYIDGKSNVILDFYGAQEFEYQVPSTPIDPESPIEPPEGGDMTRIIIEDGYEEGGQYDYNGINELTCPKGLPHELAEGYWIPQWWEGNHQTPDEGIKYFYRPEIDRKYQTREVRTGNWAWYLQSQNKVHNACLYRRYRVQRGDLVKASTYIMIVGAEGNGHSMRIGIDPTGGTEFLADSVLYSGYYSTWDPNYDPRTIEWVYQQTPQATATGDFVTVFLHSENVKYDTDSHAHWDDNLLLIEREDIPIPPGPDPDDPFDWERLAQATEAAAAAFAAVCRG